MGLTLTSKEKLAVGKRFTQKRAIQSPSNRLAIAGIIIGAPISIMLWLRAIALLKSLL
ncbi:MAG: hypothetical protein ACYTXC_19380 [Nostoc sp.]